MIEFVTVTGRRIKVAQMTGKEEAALLQSVNLVQKEKKRSRRIKYSQQLLQDHITRLVVEATPEIDFTELTIGEEVDILKCIREASFGPSYAFSTKCPHCATVSEFEVDLRNLRRDVQTCGDAACPCHGLRDYDPQDAIEQERLAADFSEIPATHLSDCPPNYRFVTPIEGVECVVSPVKVSSKDLLGRWHQEEDPAMIAKMLAEMCESVAGKLNRGEKIRALESMLSCDRLAIRDYIAKIEPGVDTGVNVVCPECDAHFESEVEVDTNFFLPKRVILHPLFASTLRSIREIGGSVQSWKKQSKSDE